MAPTIESHLALCILKTQIKLNVHLIKCALRPLAVTPRRLKLQGFHCKITPIWGKLVTLPPGYNTQTVVEPIDFLCHLRPSADPEQIWNLCFIRVIRFHKKALQDCTISSFVIKPNVTIGSEGQNYVL